MVERYAQGKLVWIDLKNPTTSELQEIMEELSIPPTLMGDLSGPVPRSTARSEGDVIKLTMDFPIVKRTDIDHAHEIKFIITKHCLVTVHYEDMEAMDRFKKEFEVITTLGKAAKRANGAHIFVSLMTVLYGSADSKLDYMETNLAEIETEIFKGNEKEMVSEISNVSKKLIAFRQALKAHDEVFRDAKPLFDSIFKTDLESDLQGTHTHYFYILRRVGGLFEALDGLRETNMALLTTKQNEIIKILTIMAFIMFPLTLISSVFGMNTKTAPIVGNNGDFWIIIGMMVVATLFFFTFFKYKKWM